MNHPKMACLCHTSTAWWSQRSHQTCEVVTCSFYASIFLILSTLDFIIKGQHTISFQEGWSAYRWLYHLWPWRSSQNNALYGLSSWRIWINNKRWLRVRKGNQNCFEDGEWMANHTYEWLSLLSVSLPSSFHYMMNGCWDKCTSL